MNNICFASLLLFICDSAQLCCSLSVPYDQEVFSVAPMMGHTNRHYHTFFRMLSKRAHLFTEMIPASQIVHLHETNPKALEDIIGINPNSHPVILQLGGRDPHELARAAQIGASFGYNGINLNCGCPSNAVSGRQVGASLMRDPSHVARILEYMSKALEEYTDVELSIKHRIGVADAEIYDAEVDRQLDDRVAYESCLKFLKTITMNASLKKVHVHARLALLGSFDPKDDKPLTNLWIPGDSPQGNEVKVDHKRNQYQAKRKSRLATIKNRSVPPLRPNIVNQLATEFQSIQFVTNGGITCIKDIHERLDFSLPNLVGCMVGRAVINHPCSFSMIDELWREKMHEIPSRGQVLKNFADYCEKEESRVQSLTGQQAGIVALRRRLVAVPFTLFEGEEGNNLYQRRLRKLVSRPDRYSSKSILLAALAEVPTDTLNRPVTEYSPVNKSYSQFSQRSGPLHRSIL